MAFIKISGVDIIEILSNGIIQIRQRDDIVDEATNQIEASSYRRWAFAPGEYISVQDARVQAVAAVVWTPEVIAAYKAQVAAQVIPEA